MTPEKLVRVVEKMIKRGDSDLAAVLVAQQVEDDLEAAEAVGDYLCRPGPGVDDRSIGCFYHFYRRQVFNAYLHDALRENDPTVAPETKTMDATTIAGAGRPDDRWAEAAVRLCGMTESEFNGWLAEQWQQVRAITGSWSVPTLRTGSRPPADRN